MFAFIVANIVGLVVVSKWAATWFWLILPVSALVWIACLQGEVEDSRRAQRRQRVARVRPAPARRNPRIQRLSVR